jgi:hypothetical protein
MITDAAEVAAMARKAQNPKLVEHMKVAAKNKKPVRKTHTRSGAENPHRKPENPGAQNPHYRASGKTHTTLDTLEGESTCGPTPEAPMTPSEGGDAANPAAANGHATPPPAVPSLLDVLMGRAH